MYHAKRKHEYLTTEPARFHPYNADRQAGKVVCIEQNSAMNIFVMSEQIFGHYFSYRLIHFHHIRHLQRNFTT